VLGIAYAVLRNAIYKIQQADCSLSKALEDDGIDIFDTLPKLTTALQFVNFS
jgi:hypothetical protein